MHHGKVKELSERKKTRPTNDRDGSKLREGRQMWSSAGKNTLKICVISLVNDLRVLMKWTERRQTDVKQRRKEYIEDLCDKSSKWSTCIDEMKPARVGNECYSVCIIEMQLCGWQLTVNECYSVCIIEMQLCGWLLVLQKSLPFLRLSLSLNKIRIDGLRPPQTSGTAVRPTVPRHLTPACVVKQLLLQLVLTLYSALVSDLKVFSAIHV